MDCRKGLIIFMENKKSRQLQYYHNKKNTAVPIDVPTASDDYAQNVLLTFTRTTDDHSETMYYNSAKKLFDALHRYLPAGVYKHFVMMMIEHDRKINKYGDLV